MGCTTPGTVMAMHVGQTRPHCTLAFVDAYTMHTPRGGDAGRGGERGRVNKTKYRQRRRAGDQRKCA